MLSFYDIVTDMIVGVVDPDDPEHCYPTEAMNLKRFTTVKFDQDFTFTVPCFLEILKS